MMFFVNLESLGAVSPRCILSVRVCSILLTEQSNRPQHDLSALPAQSPCIFSIVFSDGKSVYNLSSVPSSTFSKMLAVFAHHQRLVLYISNHQTTVDYACIFLILLILLLWLATGAFKDHETKKHPIYKKIPRKPLAMAEFANQQDMTTASSLLFRPHNRPDDNRPRAPRRRSKLATFFRSLHPAFLFLRKAKIATARFRRRRRPSFSHVDYTGAAGRYVRWARWELTPVPSSPRGTLDFDRGHLEFQREGMEGRKLYDEVYRGDDARLQTYLDLEGDYPEGGRAQMTEGELELITELLGKVRLR